MRTFVPPTSFVSSPDTEKERFLFTSISLASGFFLRHGFIVTDKPIPECKSYCLVYPETARNLNVDFWTEAQRHVLHPTEKIPQKMNAEAKDIFFRPVSKNIIRKFERHWKLIEKETWSALTHYFPFEIKWIGSLEVRLTNIGTLGSHFLLDKKKGQHLVLNVRSDSSHLEIINLLVLSLIYPYEKELGLSFTHRQTLRNFIFTRKEFRRLYPRFQPKTFRFPKIPTRLKLQSDDYLRTLKIPVTEDPEKNIKKNMDLFGRKEYLLLEKLMKSEGEILSYDEIADLLWGPGNFRSYWAINKLIQRILKKLKTSKIGGVKIKSFRGRGYGLSY